MHTDLDSVEAPPPQPEHSEPITAEAAAPSAPLSGPRPQERILAMHIDINLC